MSATYLEVEETIYRTLAAIMAVSELVGDTLTNPGQSEGSVRIFRLSDIQVDARLEIMSHALEQATGLRELFQAYIRSERERKAAKP